MPILRIWVQVRHNLAFEFHNFKGLVYNFVKVGLAKLIGKDRQNYQRVEAGMTNPTVWYLYNIAKALNVPPKELIDFINE
jgi:DNA-binding XRE family transcriptional regulator